MQTVGVFFFGSSALQTTLGTEPLSEPDGTRSRPPPNRPCVCVRHIGEWDGGNRSLSRPNSHVITTGTVSPSTPSLPHILLQMRLFTPVTPRRPGIQFNACFHTNLLPVTSRRQDGGFGEALMSETGGHFSSFLKKK